MAIITLTRGTYSGAKELAEYTAKNLGYTLLSREDLIGELAQLGWEEEKLNQARYKKLGIMERMNLQWIHYLACLRAVLAEKAKGEALVYHGNQGHLVLRDFPHVLSIKCVADLEYRIKAVMARNEYAIDRKEALRIINRIDQKRERWSKFLYGTDLNDAAAYSMVIDLSKKSIPDAFEMIHSQISLPQFQPTPESKKAIEDLAVAAKLRAKIAMECEIIDDDLVIEIKDGVVNIKGTVHSVEDAHEIRRFLAKQPEIHDVEAHLEETREDVSAGGHGH